MVHLEDPLTGDVPHRGLIDEVDEQQAQELAPQYTAVPEIQWTEAAVQQPTVVFLLGQAACLLIDTYFQHTQAVGSISVPELVRVRSPLEEEYGSTHKPVHTCTLRALPAASSACGSSSSNASSSLLLVDCPRELPAEQAVAWTRQVLEALQPKAAVIATTLPVMHYRGPGSPADEDLVFSLQTAAAAAAGAAGLPPPLPEATLLGGLPAALLAQCELQQLPATLAVGVQMQQVPDAQFLCCLGQALQAALCAAGGEAAAAALVQQRGKPQLLAALAAAADGVFRSSASSSIFS